MADAPVEVVAYDATWPERFRAERDLLVAALTPWLAATPEHVGSTSVPGLAAKPIIDIAAPVRDLADSAAAVPLLAELGYLHWADDPQHWRHWFLKPRPERRTHHLYLAEPSAPGLRAVLAFRDRLRADPVLAEDYARLKRRLAAQHPVDREAYTAAKSGFVQWVVAEAVVPPPVRAHPASPGPSVQQK